VAWGDAPEAAEALLLGVRFLASSGYLEVPKIGQTSQQNSKLHMLHMRRSGNPDFLILEDILSDLP
jgi:hypothetical protein